MKSVIIHALLAVFGLGFAYQTWTRKPEEATAPGSVTIGECSPEALQKIVLNTPTLELTVEPKREGKETRYWISSLARTPKEPEKKDADKPDAAVAAADAEQEKDKPKKEPEKPRRFLANAAFNEYLKRLTPLRAQRSLGTIAKDKDKDFGFDAVGTRMSVQCAGASFDFEAGSRAFGASQRYLRDTKSQTTYLFDEQVVSDLESSQFKFMQAELHSWKSEDVEEASVTAHGATKKLLHRDRKVADQAVWVDAAEPAKRNELYNNWFGRVTRLRARAYLPVGAEPGSDLKTPTGSEPVLTIDYKVADRPNGKLELVRVDENNQNHYYARTETTSGWVALYDSAVKDVESDVGMVVGVEPIVDKPKTANPAPEQAPEGPANPHGHNAFPMVPMKPKGHGH